MTKKSVASAAAKAKDKPSKPRKDYPLFAHASGQWAKKVRGRIFYFGKWDDPTAAENEWERQKLALLEGRDPNEDIPGETVKWLCDSFMESKQLQKERGELSTRAFSDYHRIAKHVADYFTRGRRLDSLRPSDFERYRNSLPETWGPTTINNHLRLVRVLFKYANDIEATPREIRFKLGLKAVSRVVSRKHAAGKAAKEFTAGEVWALFNAADVPMRAFILLGLNAAYGPLDIARLRIDQIKFDDSWLGEPRGKTGVVRGCSLWPETVAEIRKAIETKPFVTSPNLEPLFSLTKQRLPWATDDNQRAPLSAAFAKLKKAAGITKTGVGHYALRHTFATIAGDTKDQQAVDYIMGHKDASMSNTYREGIDPQRIRDVCEHVRQWWLAGKPEKGAASNG
jgi:integrase